MLANVTRVIRSKCAEDLAVVIGCEDQGNISVRDLSTLLLACPRGSRWKSVVSKVGLASIARVSTVCLRVSGRRFRLSAEGGLSDRGDGLSFLCIPYSYLLYYIWVDHCSAFKKNHITSLPVLVNLMNSLSLISQYGSLNHTDSSVS